MTAPAILFACRGGTIVLPAPSLVLVDRSDGGNLIVNLPRTVWERAELTPAELAEWSFLVAATGQAMLDSLPQLAGGCINYWEAGNWALHFDAEPIGPKTAPEYRQVHLHLLGRGRAAASPDWTWGEAPRFPPFARRFDWADSNRRLTGPECAAIVARAAEVLREKYGMDASDARPCEACDYPAAEHHECIASDRERDGWPMTDAPADSAEEECDIERSLKGLLTTSPADREDRPAYGCGLQRYIFQIFDAELLRRIEAEVEAAIRRWEPRIEPLRVVARQEGAPARLLVEIDYRSRWSRRRSTLVQEVRLDG
jgi:phage baseplate assembly protein W